MTLLIQARKIIEWSLIIHLFTGMYMLSNPEIFTSEEDENKAVTFFQGYAKFVTIAIKIVTGVDSARFEQVHIVFYAVGVSLFIILFVIEKLTRVISNGIDKLCCCCLKRDTEPDLFSNDIFTEISGVDQRKDYHETKRLIKKLTEKIA